MARLLDDRVNAFDPPGEAVLANCHGSIPGGTPEGGGRVPDEPDLVIDDPPAALPTLTPIKTDPEAEVLDGEPNPDIPCPATIGTGENN